MTTGAVSLPSADPTGPSPPGQRRPGGAALASRGTALVMGLCVALYVLHLGVLWTHAVDIPYWDEWEMVRPGQLDSDGPSLHSLLTQHVNHRHAASRAVIWILYLTNRWNVASHQVLNFCLFGVLLVVTARYVSACAPALPRWLVPSCTLFLLSPIHWENHFWGLQTHVHAWLLCLLLATLLLFRPRQGWLDVSLGAVLALAAMASNAAGAVASLAIAAIFLVFKLRRVRALRGPRDWWRREVLQLLAPAIAIVAGAALWSAGYERPPVLPDHAWPWTAAFWPHFLNVVALGFGIDSISVLLGALCLAVVLVPLAGSTIDAWRQPLGWNWTVIAGTVGILAGLAAVSMGRAGFGVHQAKSSRYAEMGMLLIPLSAAGWGVLLRRRPGAQRVALVALLLAWTVTFADDWALFGQYGRERGRRLAGLECARRYYLGKGDGHCPTIYPGPLAAHLDTARRLGLSFTRGLPSSAPLARTEP